MTPQVQVYVAINLSEKYHEGQKYGIKPYTYHLQAVAESVGDDPTMKVIAWLHDILEDTECTEAELRAVFSSKIVDAVVAMTKIEGEEYSDYIERVKSNPLAQDVKIHDTLCNLTESVKTNQWGRVRKYTKQLTLLVG